MGVAWGFSYHIIIFLLEKNKFSKVGFNGLFAGTFIVSWIGAKIFYLIFSQYGEYQNLLTSASFWLGGGFVFYGGLLFGIIYVLFYSYILKKIETKSLVCLIPGICISHAIGRVGCFLAGCCYGNATDVSWGIILHNERRHPVQLYEVIFLIFIFFIIIKLINRRINSKYIIYFYLISYSLIRFGLEFFRGDLIRGFGPFHLSSSQWISILIMITVFLIEIFRNFFLQKAIYE